MTDWCANRIWEENLKAFKLAIKHRLMSRQFDLNMNVPEPYRSGYNAAIRDIVKDVDDLFKGERYDD